MVNLDKTLEFLESGNVPQLFKARDSDFFVDASFIIGSHSGGNVPLSAPAARSLHARIKSAIVRNSSVYTSPGIWTELVDDRVLRALASKYPDFDKITKANAETVAVLKKRELAYKQNAFEVFLRGFSEELFGASQKAPSFEDVELASYALMHPVVSGSGSVLITLDQNLAHLVASGVRALADESSGLLIPALSSVYKRLPVYLLRGNFVDTQNPAEIMDFSLENPLKFETGLPQVGYRLQKERVDIERFVQKELSAVDSVSIVYALVSSDVGAVVIFKNYLRDSEKLRVVWENHQKKLTVSGKGSKADLVKRVEAAIERFTDMSEFREVKLRAIDSSESSKHQPVEVSTADSDFDNLSEMYDKELADRDEIIAGLNAKLVAQTQANAAREIALVNIRDQFVALQSALYPQLLDDGVSEAYEALRSAMQSLGRKFDDGSSLADYAVLGEPDSDVVEAREVLGLPDSRFINKVEARKVVDAWDLRASRHSDYVESSSAVEKAKSSLPVLQLSAVPDGSRYVLVLPVEVKTGYSGLEQDILMSADSVFGDRLHNDKRVCYAFNPADNLIELKKRFISALKGLNCEFDVSVSYLKRIEV